MTVTCTVAKTVLRQLKGATTWEEMKQIYDQYPELSAGQFSPIYNKFTSKRQEWDIQALEIGGKTGLYFDNKDREITTWTGKRIGKITNLSYFQGSGFAPVERVSITFIYKGMTFRGICSYKNMECFTAKRIK